MLLRKGGIDPDKDVTWVTEAGFGSLNIVGLRIERGDYRVTTLSVHYKRAKLFGLIRQAG